MTDTTVRVVEFTDPACPFAYSAEPFKWKLRWTFGEQLDWTTRMVGLSEDPARLIEVGFTPDVQAGAWRRLAAEHGMPMDTAERSRMAASLPACRAVVAARLHAPAQAEALLRRLRIRTFTSDLLDDPATRAGAAADVGIDPDALESWMGEAAVGAALEEDMAAARDPLPEALAQDHKLAGWEGGRRYTCPSYELTYEDRRVAVPGFQPWAAYDVALANVAPALERRPAPESTEELLRWAGTPLASKEVAVVREIDVAQAREELSRCAAETPVGADGFWTLQS